MQTPSNRNYFAIASMMNPTSLKGRCIKPIRSQPAVLPGYKLDFFGRMGFAEAVPSPGASGFHGVVHTLTEQDMTALNEVEQHLYDPTELTAKLYDGSELTVIVYCRPLKRVDEDIVGTPQERYLANMIEGATHYGVNKEYIDYLKQLETEPRPKPKSFVSFGPVDPDLPVMSFDDVLRQDGEEGRPLAVTVNGKVIQIQNPTIERTGFFRKMRKRTQSPAVEDFFPQMVYDAMYGIPKDRNDCTREHAAYVEHLIVTRLGKCGAVVIGSVKQTYKDDQE